MTFCVDTSAVIPLLLPLPSSEAVRPFWAGALEDAGPLLAPPLLFAETTSVLRRYVHLGGVLHEEAEAALGSFLRLPISVVHTPEVYLRALDLARRLGHAKAYDVQYLAVAQIQDCLVVTVDRGLHESARTLGIASRLIA